MKSRIFMYLFIFTALICLYQFKSSSNYVANTQMALKEYQEKEAVLLKLKSDYNTLEKDYKSLELALSQCKMSEKF